MSSQTRPKRSRPSSKTGRNEGRQKRHPAKRSLAKRPTKIRENEKMVILAVSPQAAKLIYKVLGKADEADPILERLRSEIESQLRA